jgi:hypothetical protein
MLRVAKIGANTGFVDSFLSDMEAAAPLAAIDGQVITFAEMTSRLVPELQGNTMFVRSTACFIEDLTASGVGARENQSRSRHRVLPFRSVKADRQAMRSHDVTPQQMLLVSSIATSSLYSSAKRESGLVNFIMQSS